jgi:hypothetical protein
LYRHEILRLFQSAHSAQIFSVEVQEKLRERRVLTARDAPAAIFTSVTSGKVRM